VWRHHADPARRGRARGARIRALAFQGGGPRPAQDELPAVRDSHPGAGPLAANRARAPGPEPPRPRAGRQVLRPYPAAPAERHLWPGRGRARAIDPGRLGRPSGIPGRASGGGDRSTRPDRRGVAC
jgi:hypothetical protein